MNIQKRDETIQCFAWRLITQTFVKTRIHIIMLTKSKRKQNKNIAKQLHTSIDTFRSS